MRTSSSACDSDQKATFTHAKTLAAVIFDVDGVLVDSWDAHLASWQNTATELGRPFSRNQFAASFGRTSREIIREYLLGEDACDELVRRIDERKEWLYRQIISESFPEMDGAAELIDLLHRDGFKLAFASSGPPENVAVAIEHLKCGAKLSAIITGADVARGKPDPEVFQRAAARLEMPATHCVVIEDAPAGIAAAQAAGMPCIALLSRGRSKSDFLQTSPDRFANALREISPQLIRELLATGVNRR